MHLISLKSVKWFNYYQKDPICALFGRFGSFHCSFTVWLVTARSDFSAAAFASSSVWNSSLVFKICHCRFWLDFPVRESFFEFFLLNKISPEFFVSASLSGCGPYRLIGITDAYLLILCGNMRKNCVPYEPQLGDFEILWEQLTLNVFFSMRPLRGTSRTIQHQLMYKAQISVGASGLQSSWRDDNK